jgi:hypothetical protein
MWGILRPAAWGNMGNIDFSGQGNIDRWSRRAKKRLPAPLVAIDIYSPANDIRITPPTVF